MAVQIPSFRVSHFIAFCPALNLAIACLLVSALTGSD